MMFNPENLNPHDFYEVEEIQEEENIHSYDVAISAAQDGDCKKLLLAIYDLNNEPGVTKLDLNQFIMEIIEKAELY